MKNFDPSNVRYLEARTTAFSVENPTYKGKTIAREDLRQIDYLAGYQLGINRNEEIIRIVLEVEIQAEIKGLRKPRNLGKLQTESYFYLLDFDDWMVGGKTSAQGTEARLDEFMCSILLGLAFSTTRGILIARAAGTILENVVLPVIAPGKLQEIQESSLKSSNP